MNCPKCNAVNNPGSKFCGGCGNDLSTVNNIGTTQQNTTVTEEIEQLMPEENIVSPQPVETQPSEPQIISNQSVEVNIQPTPTPIINPTIQPEIPNQNINIQPQPPVNVQPMNSPTVQTNNIPTQKKSSKLPLIIGIILGISLIVTIVILVINKSPSAEKEEKVKINDMFNPDKLIKVKSGDKYGYINTKGEFKIKAIYDEATDFKGDHALVKTQAEDNGIIKMVYQIIDEKGTMKKQSSREIKYVSDTMSWIIEDEVYNSSMKKISPADVRANYEDEGYYIWVNSEKNTGGIMNKEGKLTYTYNFKGSEDSIYLEVPEIDETQKERYCIVSIEADYEAIVNCDTGVVVYDYAKQSILDEDDNIFEIRDEDTFKLKEIIYIQGDKILYRSSSDEVDLYYYPGYVSIRDDSKPYGERFKYLDTKTGQIGDETPNYDDEEEEELNEWEVLTANKKFNCSTGYGLMNNEKITLPCEWDSLEYLSTDLYKYLKENNKDYIYGRKDDKWYLINIPDKKAIIEFSTSYFTKYTDSTFIHYTDSVTKNKKVHNLISNKSLNVDTDNYLTVYSNYITVKDTINKTLKYYNIDLEPIYTENL